VVSNKAEDALSILPKIDRYVDAFKNGEDKILYNAPLLLVFHGKKSIPLSDVNAILHSIMLPWSAGDLVWEVSTQGLWLRQATGIVKFQAFFRYRKIIGFMAPWYWVIQNSRIKIG
jgi:hypothetical protein